MRIVNLTEYIRENKVPYTITRLKYGEKKLPSRRKRNPKEKEILYRLTEKRWENWIKSGKLKEIAPRQWRFTLKG